MRLLGIVLIVFGEPGAVVQTTRSSRATPEFGMRR